MSAVDRREFLMRLAAAAGAGAVSPGLLPAEGTILPVTAGGGVAPRAQSVEWKKAPCRLCGVGCGLLIGVQSGRAVALRGDPESPVSKGLACVKGYHAIHALYGRDRLTRAQVRRAGRLVDVPLSEALDLVARRLSDTIRDHGSSSVALYGSAQWTVADAVVGRRLFSEVIGTPHVDTSARLYSAAAEAGLRSTFGGDGPVGTFDDVDHADVFVLWNANLAETDPVLFSRMLARRRTNPAVQIIDLANKTTRTSYAADRSVLYAPETELAIANAICRELVTGGLVNRAFVDRHVSFWRGAEDPGYGLDGEPSVQETVTEASWNEFTRFLAEYTPQRAQERSGVPVETVRWLASVYGAPARRVMSVWGPGVHRQARGTWVNNALYNVHLLAGKVGTPGNAPLALTGQPGGGHPYAWRVLFSCSAGAAQAATQTQRDVSTALGIFRALERGDVRFLWIQATNPMISLPNLARYRRAVAGSGTFVVVSEAYPTPTTDIADVVLPAAMWLEREGIFASGERRLQHFDALVRPPGDATSDAWQMVQVARRLGHGDRFPGTEAALAATVWEEHTASLAGSAIALPPLAAVKERPGVLWPHVNGGEVQRRYHTAQDPSADAAHGAFDFYSNDDHRAHVWLRPYQPPPEPPNAEFPFRLTLGAVVEHWGGGAMTRRIPALHRAVPRGYVEIHADDAAALRVRDGDMVRLVSRRGAVELPARTDFRTQPPRGAVFVPVFDEGAPVNRLTLDAACPTSGQAAFGACAVRLERVGPGGAP